MRKILFCLVALICVLGPASTYAEFQQMITGTTEILRGVYFTDNNTGYVCGNNGTIIKTTNAGASWSPLTPGVSTHLMKIKFLDANTGYVVGNSGLILRTTNAGATWTSSNPVAAGLNDICFVDAQTVIAVGDFSTAIKSTNGGLNWALLPIPINDENLTSIACSNNKILVGSAGTTNLFVSTDNGNSWTNDRSKFRTGSLSTLDVYLNGNNGFIVGGEIISGVFTPTMFKTTDAGLTWVENTTIDGRSTLYAVSVVPGYPNVVYVSGRYVNDPTNGSKGRILKSTDAGNTFANTVWGTGSIFLNDLATTATNVFIVGTGGLVITGEHLIGITPISTEVPQNFSLSQNYPNPFNPSTKIKVEILKSENIKLFIFDITGKVVTTLVNETLRPGTYEVSFDASSLSSGTYFYRLTSSSFTETKKMVLVK